MNPDKNVHKDKYIVNLKTIIGVLIGLTMLSAILFLTLTSVARDWKAHNRQTSDTLKTDPSLPDKSTGDSGSNTASYDSQLLGVVKAVDQEGKSITLFDVDRKELITLSYTGGSNITDKFGQVISVSQIPLGLMVDAGYLKENNKLIRLQTSAKAWEYIGVNNLNISRKERLIKIASSLYKYTDDLSVVDGEGFITVNELAEQDELTIRGIEETIWSITVTRGHGIVRLVDSEAFLGGNVTIGYESMQKVTENLEVTVREGSFNLTVENGKYSATKNIQVLRNQETVVSLLDLGPVIQTGMVTFDITPFGADLFIDGELTSYADAIELSVGEHDIEVSLGGYTPYSGSLRVSEAGTRLKIGLPEAKSKEEPTAVSTEDNNIITAPDQGYNDWDTASSQDNSSGSSEDIGEEEILDLEHFIYVQKPVGASVYLNGNFLGISPGRFRKIIGNHVITFIKEGYETISYTVEVPDDGLDTYINMPDLVPLGGS